VPNIGLTELLIILAIALMVIGPKKLPDLGRQFGRAIREFRKAGATVQKELGLDEVADDVRGLRDDVQKARDSVNVRKQLGLDDLGPLDLEADPAPTPAAEAAAPYEALAVETTAAASVATAATAAADTAPTAAAPETATIADPAPPAASAPTAGDVIAAPAASSDADAAGGDGIQPPASGAVAAEEPAPRKRRRATKRPADPPLEADAP
jgi:TatA/E family protein of Tat protein translocase